MRYFKHVVIRQKEKVLTFLCEDTPISQIDIDYYLNQGWDELLTIDIDDNTELKKFTPRWKVEIHD